MAADVKSLLKKAREAIDAKDHTTAQEHCKNVLRKDKQNYMGLVLLGVSLQQSENALLAFHKAVEIDRSKPLAWHGFAGYYEKQDGAEAGDKLLTVYSEMLQLDVDKSKITEILTKLGQLGLKLKSGRAIDIFIAYMSIVKNDTLREEAEGQLLELLKTDAAGLAGYSERVISVAKKIDQRRVSDRFTNIDFPATIETCLNQNFYHTNKIVRQWLCRRIFLEYVSLESLKGLRLEQYEQDISKDLDAADSSLLRCIVLFESGRFTEAYDVGGSSLDPRRLNDMLGTFLVKCTMKLCQWLTTEKLVLSVISAVKDNVVLDKLKKSLFLAYVHQSKWKRATEVGLELLSDGKITLNESAMLAECLLQENQSIDKILKLSQGTEYYDPLIALLHIKNNEVTKAKDVLEQSQSDIFIKWLYQGIAYWKLSEYDKCLMPFLKAAKLDPKNETAFMYLGHYYNKHLNDLEKSKKCYLKAFNLNNSNSETAKGLSDVYYRLGEFQENYELLQKVSNLLGQTEYWPKLQLGLYHMSQRRWDDAIINFQSVIRVVPGESIVWESLADAYNYRGSYTSALKCYQKVLSMCPNQTDYPKMQLGAIYYRLGKHADAITTFEDVLQYNAKSIIALKGMAVTHLNLAKVKLCDNLYGCSKMSAQIAIEYAIQAISIESSYSCLWTLIGEALILITRLPIKYSYVHVPEILSENREFKYKAKEDIYPLAIGCYCRAIHSTSFDRTQLYYNLGIAYHAFYMESWDMVHCHKAFTTAQHCVKTKPYNSHYWNFLGVVSMSDGIKKYDLAQHSFLKALNCDSSNEKAWTNLGVLYLTLNLYRLSNKSFTRAKESGPFYAQCWIGQALIAEAVQESEAMDLFRHTTELGYHRESALGYADWVCRTLQNVVNVNDPMYINAIKSMHAIPISTDLMAWVCENEPFNSCAHTIRGLLQERSGLLDSASISFKKALDLCRLQNRNIAALNMGRILLRTGKYKEAIQTLKTVTEASLNSACGLALGLYRTGNYEESYSTYDTALHWLTSDDIEKADLLVAMAGMVYMFKGPDEAKTLLFQSIQTSPTASSLFATCALGLLHSDQALSKLALNEMKRYDTNSALIYDVAFLKSYLLMLEGEHEKVIKTMSKCIHMFPDNPKLWYCMSKLCLQESHFMPRAASSCSQRSICLGQGSIDITKIWCVASMSELLCGNNRSSLILAQKALHVYPQLPDNWAALIAVLLPKASEETWNNLLKIILSFVRKCTDGHQPLEVWLGNVEQLVQKNEVVI